MIVPDDYPTLLEALDGWQDEAQRRHPGVIPCAPGCAACCHGPFDISVADAMVVRDTVRGLPQPIRNELLGRAAGQLERMQAIDPDLIAPFDVSRLGDARFDALVDGFAEEPCPALGEGSRCLIYPGRPMVCRMMGLGLETDTGDVIENACPIQDAFPAFAALPPQRFDLSSWERGEESARDQAATCLFGNDADSEYETTVAGAIMLSATN